MGAKTYNVNGMTCNGCANKVKAGVGAVDGIASVEADSATGQVTVTSDGNIDDVIIVRAIQEAGYEAAPA
ncbi:heavy-metal-associated domain-containing protein [Micromonospora sp. WMMC250]|uniref:heavy-metal-associated domain-containing protein n=1 Tax=Micromonospora sp. WMMC250 TaxID=3014781 RepID=UPI0022B5F692|nr:heavy metal-associated domain-containing protein [Micromonospora sp. WMMC250]MCZ7379850.1 heavy metal-associated domain-containing protein [Micromonospora sp. WMMC250]